MGICGAKRMVLVCVCLKVCACVVTVVSIYTINTRDEFSNVSVTDEYAALSRDAYAMSHLSAHTAVRLFGISRYSIKMAKCGMIK